MKAQTPFFITPTTELVEDKTYKVTHQSNPELVKDDDMIGYTYWNNHAPSRGDIQNNMISEKPVKIVLTSLPKEGFRSLKVPVKNLHDDTRLHYRVYKFRSNSGTLYRTPKESLVEIAYWGVKVYYKSQGKSFNTKFRFYGPSDGMRYSVNSKWMSGFFRISPLSVNNPSFEVKTSDFHNVTTFYYGENEIFRIPGQIEEITGLTFYVGSGAKLRIGSDIECTSNSLYSRVAPQLHNMRLAMQVQNWGQVLINCQSLLASGWNTEEVFKNKAIALTNTDKPLDAIASCLNLLVANAPQNTEYRFLRGMAKLLAGIDNGVDDLKLAGKAGEEVLQQLKKEGQK